MQIWTKQTLARPSMLHCQLQLTDLAEATSLPLKLSAIHNSKLLQLNVLVKLSATAYWHISTDYYRLLHWEFDNNVYSPHVDSKSLSAPCVQYMQSSSVHMSSMPHGCKLLGYKFLMNSIDDIPSSWHLPATITS